MVTYVGKSILKGIAVGKILFYEKEEQMVQRRSVEDAVAVTGDNFAKMFSEMDDEYFKARSADIKDASERVVKLLHGKGEEGIFYVDPDEATLAAYREKLKEQEQKRKLLAELKGKENVTPGGRKIELYANIGSIGDTARALAVLMWTVFALLSLAALRPYVEASAKPPEAVEAAMTYGTIVCAGSMGGRGPSSEIPCWRPWRLCWWESSALSSCRRRF